MHVCNILSRKMQFLQELDSKNAICNKILQEFL